MKIFLCFLIFIFTFTWVYANECKYTQEIDRCNKALNLFWVNNKKSIIPWWSISSIEDFICIQDSEENRVSQIIFDLKSREVDSEMDIFISNLYTQKDKYFSDNIDINYYTALNDIDLKATEYLNRYVSLCPEVLNETKACIWTVTNTLSKDYLVGSDWLCVSIWKQKVEAFKNLSYNILILNNAQTQIDKKKKYDQEIRTKYDNILDLMMINIWYLERIWKKWPSKTKNPH